MKALLVTHNGTQYEWKDVTWDGAFKLNDGSVIKETNIISIDEDDRTNLVKCSVCGKIFKKNTKEFAKHKLAGTTSESCFACSHLKQSRLNSIKCSFNLQPDGTYIRKANDQVKLECAANYWKRCDINSGQAREQCVYRQCANATAQPIEDFFTENPGVFDELITIDRLLECDAKLDSNCGDIMSYRIKAKNKIIAVVNAINIVDYFRVTCDREEFAVRYSKKYDKLYCCGGNKYTEWNPYNTEVYERIKKKIAELYK